MKKKGIKEPEISPIDPEMMELYKDKTLEEMDKLIKQNAKKIVELEGVKNGIDRNKNLAASTKALKAKPIVDSLNKL